MTRTETVATRGLFPILPFPIGWYQFAYSEDIKIGDVIPLRYFGRDLAAYRTESGTLHLVDAFCPHLGAHIGFGGQIEGETVICPFHHWRYGPDGVNIEIPYADRPNAQARLTTWHVQEVDGLALTWYHPRAEPPTWEVAPISELTDPAFAPVEKTTIEIHVHPQEVFENAVDLAHFLAVHGAARMPDVEFVVEGAHLRAITTNQALRGGQGYFEGSVESELWGLGVDIARIKGVIDTVAVLTLTPIEEGTVAARFTVTARVIGDPEVGDLERARRLAAKAQQRVLDEFNTDLVIWEHKRYEPSPKLASPERLITRFRKWAQQFYDWESDGRGVS